MYRTFLRFVGHRGIDLNHSCFTACGGLQDVRTAAATAS